VLCRCMRCFYVGIERHYNHGSPQFRDGDGRQAPKPRSGALKAPGFTTIPIPETIMSPLSTTGAALRLWDDVAR